MINYDTENDTAELDDLFQEFQVACQKLLDNPDLPQGLIREVERELQVETENIEQLHRKVNATMGQANEAIVEFNRVQPQLAEELARLRERGLKQHVIEGVFVVKHDTENTTAEVDTLFQELQAAYQRLMDIPGLPQGLIQEATRDFESQAEAVEQYHREMAAKTAQLRENDDELNNRTH